MTKSEAIKQARADVGALSPFGDGYVFLNFDGENHRESHPAPYDQAKAHRSEALQNRARELMGLDSIPYDGGNWTDGVSETNRPMTVAESIASKNHGRA